MERKIANMGLRIYGHAIDLMIVLMLPLLVLGFWTSGNFPTPQTVTGLQMGFSLLIYILITLMEGITGLTPGKMLAKTRVYSKSGHRVNIIRALVRNTFRLADFIGFYLLGLIIMRFSDLRQRIGDHIAGTIVVYEGDDPEYDEDNKLPTITITDEPEEKEESNDE